MSSKNRLLFCLSSLLLLLSCRKTESPDSYYKDGDVSKLFFNNPTGVNIVVLGDGFTKEDLKKGGAYDTHVKQAIDLLFTVSPYKEYKSYFNTYVVYAESKERGVNSGYDSTSSRTAFNSYYNESTSQLLAGNTEKCYSYVDKAVARNNVQLVILILNDDNLTAASGGGIAMITTNNLSTHSIVHESGHSFAGLGDEYAFPEIANNYPLDRVRSIPNLDTTSDLQKVKWAPFLQYSAYKKVVGAFEGGYYRNKGVFRPEESSVMRVAAGVLHFNTPSREAIVATILGVMHIHYDREKFIQEDTPNIISPVAMTTEDPFIPRVSDFIDTPTPGRLMQSRKNK